MGYDNLTQLSDREFQELQILLQKMIGVKLTDAKRALVISRLAKRVRELGLTSYKSYLELAQKDPEELQVLFNRLTTNVTQFFREYHHFKYLEQNFLPRIVNDPKYNKQKTIRVWSAACSTGEEPYSIAICLVEFFKKYPGWKIQILASDINTDALAKAKVGIYSKSDVSGIPYNLLKTYFKMGINENAGKFKVKESIQRLVSFKQINLISEKDYPIYEPIHVIFCRNVFIYFDKQTQQVIVRKFENHMHRDGLLMIGHSESLTTPDASNNWQLIGQTIYRMMID